MVSVLSTTQALESLVQHQPFNPEQAVRNLQIERGVALGITVAGAIGAKYFGPDWLQVVSGLAAGAGLIGVIHTHHEQREIGGRELGGLENEGFYHIHGGFTDMTTPVERGSYTKVVPIEEVQDPLYLTLDEDKTWVAMNGVLVKSHDEYRHVERSEDVDNYFETSYYDFSLGVEQNSRELCMHNHLDKPFAYNDLIEKGSSVFCIAGRGSRDRFELRYIGPAIEEGVVPKLYPVQD